MDQNVYQNNSRIMLDAPCSVLNICSFRLRGWFRGIRKIAKSDYYLRNVCLSVRVYTFVCPFAWDILALTVRIPMKFDI
jgi:hypothetical protein